MDVREKKTIANIRKAFLELRAHKPLEKITIKELVECAGISKGTFYLHYKDIYDLSETLQNELIQEILKSISHPEYLVTDSSQFIEELYRAFDARQNLIEVLFSGTQASILPLCIEDKLRAYIYSYLPELKQDVKFNIRLTYQIQGGYYAYQKHYKEQGLENVIAVVRAMSSSLE